MSAGRRRVAMRKYVRLQRQRLCVRCVCPGRAQALGRSLLLALCLTATAGLVSPARAAGDVVIDGAADDLDLKNGGGGMPSSNPRVEPILAAHPNQDVVICVAGCDGKPRAVQILPRPTEGRTGEFVPSVGDMGREVYGPRRPGQPVGGSESNDVVCVAGCIGRPGQVVQRLPELPPPAKFVPKARKDAKPGTPKEKWNEPLQVLP
jgi:hypothetical protein